MEKVELIKAVELASSAAVKGLAPDLKKEIVSELKDSLSDYAKNDELGTLKASLIETNDKLEKYQALTVGPVQEAVGYKSLYDAIIKSTKNRGQDVEVAKMYNPQGSVAVEKVTNLVTDGLGKGSPRPVDPLFHSLRQGSGVRQAFMNQTVQSANLVIPYLFGGNLSTTTLVTGYANQGLGWGYAQATDTGNQNVLERAIGWRRWEAQNIIGEDNISDSPDLLTVFMDDLMGSAGEWVAQGLATGSGDISTPSGLFNQLAVPSGTVAGIIPSTGITNILRQDFAGATLQTALAGGQTLDPNTAAGSAKILQGANQTFQSFIRAIYALRPMYRADLVACLSSQAVGQLRQLVTSFGQPLFENYRTAEDPAMVGNFIGLPVYEDWWAPSFVGGSRIRFGVIGSRSRAFRIYDRMDAQVTTSPITRLAYLSILIRGRINTIQYDPQSAIALEFTGVA